MANEEKLLKEILEEDEMVDWVVRVYDESFVIGAKDYDIEDGILSFYDNNDQLVASFMFWSNVRLR